MLYWIFLPKGFLKDQRKILIKRKSYSACELAVSSPLLMECEHLLSDGICAFIQWLLALVVISQNKNNGRYFILWQRFQILSWDFYWVVIFSPLLPFLSETRSLSYIALAGLEFREVGLPLLLGLKEHTTHMSFLYIC